MTEWKEYKFSDFVEINPSVKIPKGIPVSFVEMKDLDSSVRYCESSQKKELTGGSRFINGDTLFARITPCMENGKICQVRNLENGIGFGSTEFHILRGKDGVSDSDFVYYLSRWDEVRDHAEHNMEGSSGRQRVPKQAFDNLYLNLPPLPTQHRIASILSSLDDKIDLLYRENATLEQMAETLFRQWFVVEAKEEWEEGKLGDLIEVKYGKDHKKLLDGKIPVIGSGGIMRYADTALYDKESVLIPRKGSLNNVMYMNEPFWTVDTMFYTEMRRPNIAKFVFHFMKGQDLANMNVGSAVPSMTTEVLNNVPIDIPPQEVFDKFENAVASLYNKKEQNNKQIQTLIQIRDGLLPRLMSGK
ncbi:MAG: restriction endonuclease subunit S [Bacteroidales bacterium]|nr:restriction endonuclease subunit S [Bacteroidales bacterium]